ncbi:MAG: hypothetical protein AAGA62_14220, partial [Bacteroidota bacterium]
LTIVVVHTDEFEFQVDVTAEGPCRVPRQHVDLFYEQLRTGASKDIAMQAAIKKLLVEGSPSDRQPINWANLTLIGPVAPIYGDFPWGWALGGLALVLLSLGWWWRSRI